MSRVSARSRVVGAATLCVALSAGVAACTAGTPSSATSSTHRTPAPVEASAAASTPAARPTSGVSPTHRPPATATAQPTGAGTPTAASPSPTTPGSVTVTTTFWGLDSAHGQVVVGGYANVVESGGTCRLTITHASDARSVTTTATPDATTTACGTLAIQSAGLASGTWVAVLSYRSSSLVGQADPVQIEVP